MFQRRPSWPTPAWPPSGSTIVLIWAIAFISAVVAVGLTQYLLTVFPSYSEANPVMAAVIKHHGLSAAVFSKCALLTSIALTAGAISHSRFYHRLFIQTATATQSDRSRKWWARTTEASCAIVMATIMTVDALWNTYTLLVSTGFLTTVS